MMVPAEHKKTSLFPGTLTRDTIPVCFCMLNRNTLNYSVIAGCGSSGVASTGFQATFHQLLLSCTGRGLCTRPFLHCISHYRLIALLGQFFSLLSISIPFIFDEFSVRSSTQLREDFYSKVNTSLVSNNSLSAIGSSLITVSASMPYERRGRLAISEYRSSCGFFHV